MEYLLTSSEMKDLDHKTIEEIGISSMVLMEKAALSVITAIKENVTVFDKILVVCGSGNNGGDGIAIARILHLQGKQVRIVFVGDIKKATTETKKQIEIAEKYNIKIYNTFDENEYNVIIDAIFGIGLTRNIQGAYKDAIQFINQSKGYKISVDIPSGISANSGKVMKDAVSADLTVAIAYKKLGHVFYPGTQFCNKTIVADIGIYGAEKSCLVFSYTREDLKQLPPRYAYSNKGSYGKALIIAGSVNMAGAAYLAAVSAYKTGCGLVRIVTPKENREILQSLIPEAILSTYDNEKLEIDFIKEAVDWADVIDIGPGFGVTMTAKQILETVLKTRKCPLILDADAINLLAKYDELLDYDMKNVILTPHLKEMSRICKSDLEEIKENLITFAIDLALKYKLICVLKDARTIVADYRKKVYINQSGNHGMAKAGSGDVLSGIITGLLAQHMNPFEGAALGVYIHGMAGDAAASLNGKYSILARDIANNINKVMQ